MDYPVRFWLITAATVAGVLLTGSLGRWQLSRAAEKEALQAVIDSRSKQPALSSAALVQASDAAAVYWRPVSLQGHWVSERTVFLDNRQMRGQPGFFVVTPFRLAETGTVVLVQRGWVRRNFVDRSALPALPVPAGLVEVQGRVAPPPSRLYDFQGEDLGPIRQNLDLRAFAVETGLPLWQASVQQTGADGSGLLRDWPAPNTGVEKHYGYAFQWFGLAALLSGLYVWFQFIRRPSVRGAAAHARG